MKPRRFVHCKAATGPMEPLNGLLRYLPKGSTQGRAAFQWLSPTLPDGVVPQALIRYRLQVAISQAVNVVLHHGQHLLGRMRLLMALMGIIILQLRARHEVGVGAFTRITTYPANSP